MLLKIAGLLIDFDTRYPEYVKSRCGNYIVERGDEGEKALCLKVTDEYKIVAESYNIDLEEAELYAPSVPLSELLPGMHRLITHGVAIECDGKGFVFTARSGVGKSTHAFLWQKYLGGERVKVISGDKPILWFRDDEVLACGTPWNGKEQLDENRCVPLKGLCLLKRGKPRIERASKEDTLDFLMNQVFLPREASAQVKTFQLLENLYERVPVYHLWTDMSRKGVMVSSKELLSND